MKFKKNLFRSVSAVSHSLLSFYYVFLSVMVMTIMAWMQCALPTQVMGAALLIAIAVLMIEKTRPMRNISEDWNHSFSNIISVAYGLSIIVTVIGFFITTS